MRIFLQYDTTFHKIVFTKNTPKAYNTYIQYKNSLEMQWNKKCDIKTHYAVLKYKQNTLQKYHGQVTPAVLTSLYFAQSSVKITEKMFKSSFHILWHYIKLILVATLFVLWQWKSILVIKPILDQDFQTKTDIDLKYILPKVYSNDILSRCHGNLAPGICLALVHGIYKALKVLKLQTTSSTN